MVLRDERGRFLPGAGGRPLPEDQRRTVVITVRVTTDLADSAFVAAGRRGTTLSELLRSYMLRLASELQTR